MRTSGLLYKSFVRSKLESNLCILKLSRPQIKNIESTQYRIMCKMACVSTKTSKTILSSLYQMEAMSFRIKWLQTSYIMRYGSLPVDHILKQISAKVKPMVSKLAKNTFERMAGVSREQLKQALKIDHIRKINEETKSATCGYLSFKFPSPNPYLRTFISPMDRRIINRWILKKFPAQKPTSCQNCFLLTANQTHLAICGRILQHICPDIPERWRVEHLISNACNFPNIAEEIRRATTMCLVC